MVMFIVHWKLQTKFTRPLNIISIILIFIKICKTNIYEITKKKKKEKKIQLKSKYLQKKESKS